MAMGLEDTLFMGEPSMIKTSLESIQVQECYQWQTVAGIQTQVSFLSL